MQDTVLRPSRPRARFGLSRKLLFGRPSSWLIDLLLHDECRISRAIVLVGETADCCPCMTLLSVSVCIRKERTFSRLSRPPAACRSRHQYLVPLRFDVVSSDAITRRNTVLIAARPIRHSVCQTLAVVPLTLHRRLTGSSGMAA